MINKYWKILLVLFFCTYDMGAHAQSSDEIPIISSLDELALQVSDDQKLLNEKGQVKYFYKMDRANLVSYLPDQPNGASVIICPGGGYKLLNVLNAGYMAERLVKMGITAFVLVHRLPDGSEENRELAYSDTEQAIMTIKEQAEELGLNENLVGLLGSSAGGHVAAMTTGLLTNTTEASMKPDFLVLAWPVISMKSAYTHLGSRERLMGASQSSWQVLKYSAEEYVNENTPPTFLVHANDDRSVSPENSILFYQALLKVQIPAELHIYESGGHGFGMEPNEKDSWMDEMKKWLEKRKII